MKIHVQHWEIIGIYSSRQQKATLEHVNQAGYRDPYFTLLTFFSNKEKYFNEKLKRFGPWVYPYRKYFASSDGCFVFDLVRQCELPRG